MKSLYKRILGEQYEILPFAVRQLHDYETEATYKGRASVKRGKNIFSNLLANLLSLPKTNENAEVIVHFESKNEKELWNRSFNGEKFNSLQWQVGDLLYERLNFTTLIFKIVATNQMLDLQLQQVYVFGIHQMRFICPKVIARETETDNKFHFFIQTTLPLLGLLVEYEGSLERVS
ncbi:MAG: DUF4166 domain-containing protein [Pseudomonadota bacterium]